MTLTYDLSGSPTKAQRRSQLRLLIGDTTADNGPRPNRGNYKDAELDAFSQMEDGDLNRTAARAFEALAAEWSRYAGSYRLGPESEEARQADAYAARARTLREMYGYTVETTDDDCDSAILDWSDVYDDWVGKF